MVATSSCGSRWMMAQAPPASHARAALASQARISAIARVAAVSAAGRASVASPPPAREGAAAARGRRAAPLRLPSYRSVAACGPSSPAVGVGDAAPARASLSAGRPGPVGLAIVAAFAFRVRRCFLRVGRPTCPRCCSR